MFVRSGISWSQQANLKASNTGSIDLFGDDVAISGDMIVVAANSEDSNATGVNGNQLDNSAVDSGAAYVFARSGTSWSQSAYLKASNTGGGDKFALGVSLSGATVVAGSRFEDSNATGMNGDGSNNAASDAGAAYVFSIDTSATPFCAGDGTGTACPCANTGSAGRGCNNTVSSGGAGITGSGVASISSDTLVLSGAGAVPFGPGLFFQGSSSTAPGIVFGNGLLCLGGTTHRLEIVFAGGTGASSTTVPIHSFGADAAGDLRHDQLWHRDSPNFGACTSAFNLSNAISLTWIP